MIEEIKHFSSKTFNNYTNPDDLKFVKNNIIFGYNGRGKSTLASGLVTSFINNGGDEEKYRFFNKDYVNNSLLLQDSDGHKRIKGVIANFGKKDTDLEIKIQNLRKSLVDCDALKKELSEKESSLRKAIDEIHDRRKGNARISKKPKDTDILKVIEYYYSDLAQALEIEPDEAKLSQIIGDDRFSETIVRLESLNIQTISPINLETYSSIKRITTCSYTTESIPPSSVIDWLNEGLRLHNAESTERCLFCGHSIHIESIQSLINQYNANQAQKDATVLKDFKATLDKIVTLSNNNLSLFSHIERLLSIELQGTKNNLTSYLSIIETFAQSLSKKIQDMNYCKLEYDNNLETSINETIRLFDELTKQISQEIAALRNNESDKELLVKGAIGLEIRNSSDLQRRINGISSLNEDLARGIANNKNINSSINKLKHQKSATSDFANFITDILANLGMRFQITPDSSSQNYLITLAETNQELTVSDISEGEKNILALLFFYYELFTDSSQQSFKGEIDLIVIDDPITSLDEINHMFILDLVERILSITSPQVFIFTHIWEDVCTLGFKFKHSNNNKYFEVKKNTKGNSYLVALRNNISPYNHHFAEVYDFSKRILDENMSDCDIYHMPNTIRLVLEGFLSNKTRRSSPTKANEMEIARVLFNKNWEDISEDKRVELGELLLVINAGSHHIQRNPEQVQRVAKFLMRRIENVDKVHFDSFKTAE